MTTRAGLPDLLPGLGRLVRGLSAVFWGLPISLAVTTLTARGERFHVLGLLPPILVMLLLLHGVNQLAGFQAQERIWMRAVERVRLMVVIGLGLSPFVYWWPRTQGLENVTLPVGNVSWTVAIHSVTGGVTFITVMIQGFCLTWLATLFFLNPLLRRLAAMIPDETLRHDTRVFTRFNESLLMALMLLVLAYFVLHPLSRVPRIIADLLVVLEGNGLLVGVFILLIPLSLTMSLLWKAKEVVVQGVFNGR